jgi:hypothetical protein
MSKRKESVNIQGAGDLPALLFFCLISKTIKVVDHSSLYADATVNFKDNPDQITVNRAPMHTYLNRCKSSLVIVLPLSLMAPSLSPLVSMLSK